MSTMTIPTMTAPAASGFAMPICASLTAGAHGLATVAARTAPTYVVRERLVAGDALVKGSLPGTTAWSPPTC